MTPPWLSHFILTRYALRWEGRPLPSVQWLLDREKLFEAFTLPSVARQTVPPTAWVLFVDQELCNWLEPCVERWQRVVPRLVVVPTTESWGNFNRAMRRAMRAVPDSTTHVASTRLDNDDAIAPDFLALVQSVCVPRAERYFVNFSVGENWTPATGRREPHPHPTSMFITCVEPVTEICGVYTWAHNSVRGVGQVIQLDAPARWTHILHERNEWPPGRTA